MSYRGRKMKDSIWGRKISLYDGMEWDSFHHFLFHSIYFFIFKIMEYSFILFNFFHSISSPFTNPNIAQRKNKRNNCYYVDVEHSQKKYFFS